jgi:hypothetical protein
LSRPAKPQSVAAAKSPPSRPRVHGVEFLLLVADAAAKLPVLVVGVGVGLGATSGAGAAPVAAGADGPEADGADSAAVLGAGAGAGTAFCVAGGSVVVLKSSELLGADDAGAVTSSEDVPGLVRTTRVVGSTAKIATASEP